MDDMPIALVGTLLLVSTLIGMVIAASFLELCGISPADFTGFLFLLALGIPASLLSLYALIEGIFSLQ